MSKDTYVISLKNKDSFNIENANVICEDSIYNANFSNTENLYIDANISSDLKRTILQKAKLTIKEFIFEKDGKQIKAYTKAALNSSSKYTQNDKGYVGEDNISLATLEIEEIGRVAYENTNKVLVNVDYSSTLISSNLWRTVLNNINEDYPTISLINMNIEDINKMPNDDVTLIFDPVIAPIAIDSLSKQGFTYNAVYTCPTGLTSRLFTI